LRLFEIFIGDHRMTISPNGSPIVLSARGLERAARVSETPFLFRGNGCEVECTSFQAAFISPRVYSLIQQDRTVDSFFLEVLSEGQDENRIFGFFEDLMKGSAITPLPSDLCGLREVATWLGNTELLDHILDAEGPIDVSTVCGRLERKSCLGCSVGREIWFAATHFHELNVDDLRGLDISVLDGILSSRGLRLQSEDSLFDFILSLGSGGGVLFLRLRTEYMSSEKTRELWEVFTASNRDPYIWSALCHRLVPAHPVGHEIPMTAAGSLDGIISYLTEKYGGNVHEMGIVRITARSVHGQFVPQNVADLTTRTSDSRFESEDEAGQWICWDFGEMWVEPTHYTIRTGYLQSWVVEGSLDGEHWAEIDRKINNQDFTDRWSTVTFAVRRAVDSRFIRLTQIGRNHLLYGSDVLELGAVEFFGIIDE
jgi:hypothetical protein